MSRTERRTTNVRKWYSREAKWARKSTNRQNRNRTNGALRTMRDAEEVITDKPRHTGGWITH